MSDLKMGPVETRFAEIIWEKEPVGSTELVKLAEEALGWKKSTTYTVLKRLCDRGIFRNEGGPSPACCPGRITTPPRASSLWRRVFPAPSRRLSRHLPGERSYRRMRSRSCKS